MDYFTVQIDAQNLGFILTEFSNDELTRRDMAYMPMCYIVTMSDGETEREIRILTQEQLEAEFILPKNFRRNAFTKIAPKANVPMSIPVRFIFDEGREAFMEKQGYTLPFINTEWPEIPKVGSSIFDSEQDIWWYFHRVELQDVNDESKGYWIYIV